MTVNSDYVPNLTNDTLNVVRRIASIIHQVASEQNGWFLFLPEKGFNPTREKSSQGLLLQWVRGASGPVQIITPEGTLRFNGGSNGTLDTEKVYNNLERRLGLVVMQTTSLGDRLLGITQLDGEELPEPII